MPVWSWSMCGFRGWNALGRRIRLPTGGSETVGLMRCTSHLHAFIVQHPEERQLGLEPINLASWSSMYWAVYRA